MKAFGRTEGINNWGLDWYALPRPYKQYFPADLMRESQWKQAEN